MQAIGTEQKPKFRRGFLIKQTQELAKVSQFVLSSRHFMLVGRNWQQPLLTVCLVSRNAINIQQYLAKKNPQT